MATVNFSGIASGIDAASLIDALIEQKRTSRINPLEQAQERDKETNSALGELKTLLQDLRSSVDSFRTVSGGAVKSALNITDESIISGSTYAKASEGSYEISVNQRARNGSVSFNERFNGLDALVATGINDSQPAADRTVSFQIGSGSEQESIDIEITSTTTATDIVEAFNSQSEKATASLINVGSQAAPAYALSISSKNSGTEKGLVSVTVGSELAAGGYLNSSTLQQAQDAKFSISGISGTISRPSNTVSDLIPGVSINLEGIGTSTLTVAEDSQSTTSKVRDLVEKINSVLSYIKENDSVTQEKRGGETINIFGSLSNSSVDENIVSSLRSVFSSTKAGNSILADIGIKTARDGTLEFDEQTFETALSQNSSNVGTLLENLSNELGGPSGTIAQFSRFQGVIDRAVSSSENTIRQRDQKIADLEGSLSREEQLLQSRYARLEGLIGELNSQQSALVGLFVNA